LKEEITEKKGGKEDRRRGVWRTPGHHSGMRIYLDPHVEVLCIVPILTDVPKDTTVGLELNIISVILSKIFLRIIRKVRAG
jgi:hypothetical protein